MFQFITIILSLSVALSSFAADKRAPASAAGKAKAMKYIEERKPAQETQITTGDQMMKRLSELMAYLESSAPNKDKKAAIDDQRQILGDALASVIQRSKSPNDEELQKKAYVVDNVMGYFSNLELDAKGQWSDKSCRNAMTQAHINGYNPATEKVTPGPVDNPALVVIEKMCGFKLSWKQED